MCIYKNQFWNKLLMKMSDAVWQMPWKFYLQSSFSYYFVSSLILTQKDTFLADGGEKSVNKNINSLMSLLILPVREGRIR